MKNIFKITTLALVLFSAFSCENDDQMIVSSTGAPELLTPTSGASYVLLPENASSEATTLVWNHPSFDVQTVANYDVEVAVAGTNFETIASTQRTPNSARFLVWTVENLNTVAVAAGLEPFTEGELDVRVKSSLGDTDAETEYSNVITIKVTPYTTEKPKLWVPGGYQAASGYGSDWTHSTAPQLASEGFGLTNFEGYVYFATAQDGSVDGQGFKFSNQANWDGTNYGDDGTFTGVLSPTGGNISVAAGYYRVKVDTDPEVLTYNLQSVGWGIIGSSTPTGWDSDTDMTYNPETKKWTITIALIPGAIKFRYNDTWNVGDAQWNLGLFDASKTGENYGGETMSYGGGDIPIEAAGTYLVTLDLSNPRAYTYSLTPQ